MGLAGLSTGFLFFFNFFIRLNEAVNRGLGSEAVAKTASVNIVWLARLKFL